MLVNCEITFKKENNLNMINFFTVYGKRNFDNYKKQKCCQNLIILCFTGRFVTFKKEMNLNMVNFFTMSKKENLYNYKKMAVRI